MAAASLLVPRAFAQQTPAPPSPVVSQIDAGDEVLRSLRKELTRSFTTLSKEKVPPYFISYQLTDNRAVMVTSSFGAITTSDDSTTRHLDIDLRVGEYKLDNTHSITR
ncbi:MAG TPA: hypothetical protein VEB03_00040, partial [Candidatus Nanoarchaeia archaeon]|nr:hypothetical protein [Candidatus Nanoarchaeia archaeon]